MKTIDGSTHLITSDGRHLVPYIEYQSLLQEGRNLQKSIESRPIVIVPKKLFRIFALLRSQSCPPLLFEAEIVLKVILAYFAVDLAVGRLLLVGIILDQTCSKLAVGVCGNDKLDRLIHQTYTLPAR